MQKQKKMYICKTNEQTKVENMTKLKKRIKRSLASFLKDELLEFIGYDDRKRIYSPEPSFRVNQVDFETLCCEARLEINSGRFMDERVRYEENLKRIKEDFMDQIMDHIHVESFELTNPQFSYQRVVRMTLRVQKKQ